MARSYYRLCDALNVDPLALLIEAQQGEVVAIDPLAAIRPIAAAFAASDSALALGLIGSRARGCATRNADWDLAVTRGSAGMTTSQFLAFKQRIELEALSRPAPGLRNVYSVLRVNPERIDPDRAENAEHFEAFLLDPESQRLISEFGRARFDRPLFRPLHLQQKAQR